MRKRILLLMAFVVCLCGFSLEALSQISERLSETDPVCFSTLFINDSVDPVTGEFHEEHTDLVASGKVPLAITRVYGPDFGHALLLSPGWWLKLSSQWHYLYDAGGQIVEIQQLSQDQTQLLNWVRLHRTSHPDGSSEMKIEACDGTTCCYRFERPNQYGPGLLVRVDLADGGQLRYRYRRDAITGQYRLIRREDADGGFLINEYEDGSDRVICQLAPVGVDETPVLTARFEYGPDFTQAYDAQGHKVVYSWSEQQRLVSRIDTYLENTIYRTEHFLWEDQRLIRYEVADGDAVKLFTRIFRYDQWGNCIEMALQGDLSGLGSQDERYAIHYRFANDDTRTLLEVNEDNGRSVTFHYDQASKKLLTKLLWDGQSIRQRLFYSYDSFGYPCQIILDDGCSEDVHDLQGVSERRITDTVAKTQLPGAGMPLLVDEKYLDLETGFEKLLRTTISSYDASGKLIREEFFDADARSCGCLEHGERDPPAYVKSASKTHDLAKRLIVQQGQDNERRVSPTTFRYDVLGQLVASTDSYGNETYYEYDALGRCIKTVYPKMISLDDQLIEPTIQYVYDGLDRPLIRTDQNGYTTHLRYNMRGQPIAIEHADGTNETLVYHLDGSLKTKKNRLNVVMEDRQDLFGRLQERNIILASGERIALQAIYSGFRLLGTFDSLGHETLYTHDFSGQLTVKTIRSRAGETTYQPVGDDAHLPHHDQQVSYDYWHLPPDTPQVFHNTNFLNALGQRVLQKTVVDSTGNQEITTHDAYGRIVEVELRDALGQRVAQRELRYDAAGNQVMARALQTDASFWTLACTYGPENRLESITEGFGTPHESTTRLGYNPVGQLDSLTKPDGCILYYQYDGFGRVHELLSSDGTIAYRYNYDEDGYPVLIEDLVHSSLTKRDYDIFGNIRQEEMANGLILHKSYDSQGRPICLHLPDGSAVDYRYEDRSLLSIHRMAKQGHELYSHIYHKHGGADLEESSLIGELGSLKMRKNSSGHCTRLQSPYWSQTIPTDGVDANGRVTCFEITDPSGSYDKRFAYDAVGQLTGEGGVGIQHYTYDRLANRKSKGISPYEINGANQLMATPEANYGYDLNGNRVTKAMEGRQLSYQYDALGRLIAVEDPEHSRVEYTYDPFHRRMSKKAFSWDVKAHCWSIQEEHNYLYEGKWEIGAVNGAGEIVQLRVLGSGLAGDIGSAIAMEFEGRAYAPIHDHTGSVVCLVDVKQRKVAEYYRRTTFGEEQLFRGDGQLVDPKQALNPWRFSSKRYDVETGLVYYGRRFYDPEVGRWLTKDPLGSIDGPNDYVFLQNNPVSLIDAEGLFSLDAVWERASNVLFDYVRSIGAIATTVADLLHRDMRVLTDVREQALLIGTQLIGPRIWDVIGFYAADPESGVYGHGEMSNKLRFSHINGIQNTREDAIDKVKTISDLHGGVNIHYTYRPTAGWTWDLINACCVKVGYMSPTAYCLANMWKSLIDEVGGTDGGGMIIHYAHSLGGAETGCARRLLTPAEQKMIRVFTFGSPNLLPAEGFQSVTNYVSRLDPICLSDPVRYLEGFLKLDRNVVFVGSYWGIPLLDHLLVSSSYRLVLECLGKDYGAWPSP